MLRNLRQRRIIISSLTLILTVTLLSLWVLRTQAATYTIDVNSIVDGSMATLALNPTCDLREAITIVNSGIDAGSDCSFGGIPDLALDDFRIRFTLAGSEPTIELVSALPVITSSLDIAGFLDLAAANEHITLEPATGVTIGVGLSFGQDGLINADNSRVFSMSLRGFEVGIRVNNVASVQIGGDGVNTTNLENYIYDNMFGIDVLGVSANSTVISNNYIGIDEAGDAAGNSMDGILVRSAATATVIGGTLGVSAPNWIGSNGRYGIYVSDVDTILINSNIIGSDTAGFANDRGNTSNGIMVVSAIKARIEDNTVGFNGENGIVVNSSPNTLLQFNSVGTLPGSSVDIANALDGISITSSSGSRIVGGGGTQYSRVFNNGRNGIAIINSQRVIVEDTLVYANASLGIDLGSNGVTANDAGDGDAGPNAYLNYPVINSAALDGGGDLVLTGNLATGAGNYRMVFYVSEFCDIPSGFGEGEAFLQDGGTPFEINGTAGAFTATLTGGPYTPGYSVTALTISDSGVTLGDTSEFAQCVPITNDPLLASFTASATIIVQGQSVFFDNTSTGPIAVTRWFIDGNPVATSYDLLQIFSTPGTYTITLEIEDNGGATDDTTLTPVIITVLALTATPVPPTPVPPVPTTVPTVTPIISPTATLIPTITPIPPTATLIPTITAIPPTATLIPTTTDIPPTATLIPTATDIPPTATLIPTATDIPPTATLIPTVTGTPDLLVTVVGNGANTMSVVVVNAGLNDANNVIVQENLRPNVVYRAAEPGEPICTEVGGIVTCRLGTIAGGDSDGVTIQVSTDGEAPDSGVTIVTADGVSAQIIDEPYISKIGNPPIAPPGSEITYTIRVINPTDEIATDMLIQDEMPDVIEILDANATAGDLTISGQSISLSLDELGPGERVILTIDARVSDAEEVIDSIINTACVTSSSNPSAKCAQMRFLAVEILPETGQISISALIMRWIAVLVLSGLMISGIIALYWRLRRQ